MTLPIDAACTGDQSTVLEFLKGEPGPDAKNSLLLHAIRHNQVDIVSLLCEQGADPNTPDEWGFTGLHMAAQAGYPALFSILLAKGCCIDRENNGCETALHLACILRQHESVQELLRLGANPHSPAFCGYTPLHYAAYAGASGIVKELLRRGASPQSVSESNETTLHMAACSGDLETMLCLLNAGVPLATSTSTTELTAIDYAAENGHAHLVQLLWERGATSARDRSGNFRASILASQHLHLESVRLLREAYKDDFPLSTALLRASEHNTFCHSKPMFGFFLIADGSEKRPTPEGTKKAYPVIEYLVAQGANLHASDRQSGRTALHWAASWGDLASVQLLVAKGANVHARDKHGATPLHIAAGGPKSSNQDGATIINDNDCQNLAVVRYLIEQGADIHAIDEAGYTPFHKAAANCVLPIVRELVEHGARLQSPINGGYTALHWAAKRNASDLLHYLLGQDIEVDAATDECETALHWAASHGSLDCLELLLQHGADIEALNNNNLTPIQFAACKQQHAAVAYLRVRGAKHVVRTEPFLTPTDSQPLALSNAPEYPVKHGASVKAEDKYCPSSLHTAGGNPNVSVEMMEFLIAEGADVNAQSMHDWTPLHAACRANNAEKVKCLLTSGADVGATDANGYQPLHCLVENSSDENLVRLLLEYGADVCAITNTGLTPLHLAASSALPILQLLVAKGAQVDPRDQKLCTPLHKATVSGNLEGVAYLLELGAEQQAQDKSGKTPLHFAAMASDCGVAQYLVQHGSVIDAQDHQGVRPIHLAAWCCPDTLSLLIEAGADVTTPDHKGKTPLHLAIQYQVPIRIIRTMLEKGASIHAVDQDGSTPFHIAVTTGNTSLVRALLDLGADVHALDASGATPLMAATQHIESCSQLIIQLLLDSGSDPFANDLNGKTAHHFAKENKHHHVVRLLEARSLGRSFH